MQERSTQGNRTHFQVSPPADLICAGLLSMDQVNYRFDAIVVVYVSWLNPSGISTFFKNNVATNCADASRTD